MMTHMYMIVVQPMHAHMHNVQKELARLRQKVVDVEESLQKNEKIHRLEESREWYRSESLRLDGYCTAMKKDLKYMLKRTYYQMSSYLLNVLYN